MSDLTKLVCDTEQDAIDLKAWMDTQLSEDYSHAPVERAVDFKWHIKKHPTLDMTGCGISYTEAEWENTWIIPDPIDATNKKLQIYNTLVARVHGKQDNEVPKNFPYNILGFYKDAILQDGKPVTVTYYKNYDFETKIFSVPVVREDYTYVVTGLFEKRTITHTWFYEDETECSDTKITYKCYGASDGTQLSGKKAINEMRNNIILTVQMKSVGYILATQGLTLITATAQEVTDATDNAKEFSSHLEKETQLYRDGTTNLLVDKLNAIDTDDTEIYPTNTWLLFDLGGGTTPRDLLVTELDI
jgi:hypothetical protein